MFCQAKVRQKNVKEEQESILKFIYLQNYQHKSCITHKNMLLFN